MKSLLLKAKKGTTATIVDSDPIAALERVRDELKAVHKPIKDELNSASEEIQKWKKRVAKANQALSNAKTDESRSVMEMFKRQAESYVRFYEAKHDKVTGENTKMAEKLQEVNVLLTKFNGMEMNRHIERQLEEMARQENIDMSEFGSSLSLNDRNISQAIHSAKALMELRAEKI